MSTTQRIVIKVGSTLITNEGAGVDHDLIRDWVAQIAVIRENGAEVLLVSSGAIAEGMQRLGWRVRPHEVNRLQAAAAVGQMGLVRVYESAFREHGIGTAQVLLTHDDLGDRQRYLNARSTLTTLIALGVVPVINENDTVITDEIKFGDNDTLGALVANLIDADALWILTDQRGLYTADPRIDASATLLVEARAGDPALEKMAGGSGSALGKGGMLTKVLAARRAALGGTDTVIAYGREERVLTRLSEGEPIGTRLVAQTSRVNARKAWLAGHLKPAGRIWIDDGAARALTTGGRSLLPVGVVNVEGEFQRGELVACVDSAQREVARGLINYPADEARTIAGKPSTEIEAILGYLAEPELIHRDNLVLV